MGEFIYLLSLPLLVNMILVGVCSGRLQNGVLGAGTARKNGGLRCGLNSKREGLKGGGGLRCGSGQKMGSLPRHIPILNIYVSTPPPPRETGQNQKIL